MFRSGRVNHFIIIFAIFSGLYACSGGSSGISGTPGGGGIGEVQNAAAPMQTSGTSSPNLDPEGDFKAMYQATFNENDLDIEKSGIKLSGNLQMQSEKPGDFSGRILKIIDRRVKKYSYVPLEMTPDKPQHAQFEADLDISALSFEELLSGKALSFYVLKSEAATESGMGVLADCETPVCADSSYGMVKIFNPNAAVEQNEVPQPAAAPPPPGGPPSGQGLKRPEGKLKMPGT